MAGICIRFEATDGSLSTGLEVAVTVANATADKITSTVITIVKSMSLNQGIKNSLLSKLDNVLGAILKGNGNSAENILNALVNEVNTQSGKQLTLEQAANLTKSVEIIKANLN